jgi:hypothetical protein
MRRLPRGFWRSTRLPLLTVAAGAAVVLAHDCSSGRRPPCSVGELVDRLRERGLFFVAVPVSQINPNVNNGAFLCVRDRSLEELAQRRWLAAYQADWVGVVHAERWPAPAHELMLGHVVGEWPTYAARVGDVLLFGDPEMLRRIVAALGR